METSMIWAEKTVPVGQGAAVQEKFETLFMKLGAPAGMMLVSTRGESIKTERLIMSLPEASLLAAFEGFSPTSENQLPESASLLVADQGEFRKRFSFPSRI
jgi:hypothetical protein